MSVCLGHRYVTGSWMVYAILHTGEKVVFGKVWRGDDHKWYGSLPLSRVPDVEAKRFAECRELLWGQYCAKNRITRRSRPSVPS